MKDSISYYDVVRIRSSPSTIAAGLNGRIGVVVGATDPFDAEQFAVLLNGETYMVDARDLESTGDRVGRAAIYGGETIRVAPERYSSNGDSSAVPRSDC